jgi:hypothetical protein
MPMTDFEKTQTLLETAKMHEASLRNSEKLQWQITLVLWAGIFAAISFFYGVGTKITCCHKTFLAITGLLIGWMYYRFVKAHFVHRTKLRTNWAKCISKIQSISETESYINTTEIDAIRAESFLDTNMMAVGATWLFLIFLILVAFR